MKTKIISQRKVQSTNILDMEVHDLSNVISLTICTQKDDVEEFNGSYMDDPGWMDGTSYISCRYSYGDLKAIENVKETIIRFIPDIDMDEDDCLELFVFVFDAGNGKALLVSNIEEHLSYNDIDFEDIEFYHNEDDYVVHMVGGSVTDDCDIGNSISECLMSHPLTKGFKMPGNEVYEQFAEVESLTWDEYCESFGTSVFCDDNLQDLKKGETYFDMFNAATNLVICNPEIFPERKLESNMNHYILTNYEYCKDIPCYAHLVYKHGNTHKYYDIELQNNAVLINYGGFGKTSSSADTEFDTEEEAKKFHQKKIISKIKSGYFPTPVHLPRV